MAGHHRFDPAFTTDPHNLSALLRLLLNPILWIRGLNLNTMTRLFHDPSRGTDRGFYPPLTLGNPGRSQQTPGVQLPAHTLQGERPREAHPPPRRHPRPPDAHRDEPESAEGRSMVHLPAGLQTLRGRADGQGASSWV